MWQISVEPMPSRISRPVRSRQRSKRLAGQSLAGAGAGAHAREVRRRRRAPSPRASARKPSARRRRASAGGGGPARRPPRGSDGPGRGRRRRRRRTESTARCRGRRRRRAWRPRSSGRPSGRAQHVRAVRAAADPHVVLQMDDALRLARRAARIQQEGEAVAVGCGVGLAGCASPRRRTASGMFHAAQPSLAIAAPSASGRVEDQDPRVAVGEDDPRLLGLQERVDGNRHGACGDRAPEHHREKGSVGEEDRHAVAPVNSRPRERSRKAPHVPVELGVGRLAIVRRDRDPSAAALRDVPAHEPLRGVEAVRKMFGGAHASVGRSGHDILRAVAPDHAFRHMRAPATRR